MKYMLLIYSTEKLLTASEREECMAASKLLCHELNASGQYLSAAPLHSVSMATSVQIREGKRLVTDGPFAETTEQLGGYYLIDAKDLDEAISISARIPSAKFGTVEIRPVFELTGMPAAS